MLRLTHVLCRLPGPTRNVCLDERWLKRDGSPPYPEEGSVPSDCPILNPKWDSSFCPERARRAKVCGHDLLYSSAEEARGARFSDTTIAELRWPEIEYFLSKKLDFSLGWSHVRLRFRSWSGQLARLHSKLV
jgi:hypothetical protein